MKSLNFFSKNCHLNFKAHSFIKAGDSSLSQGIEKFNFSILHPRDIAFKWMLFASTLLVNIAATIQSNNTNKPPLSDILPLSSTTK